MQWRIMWESAETDSQELQSQDLDTHTYKDTEN